MEAIRTKRVKRINNRARKGEFNLIWLIVAVIAVVMAVVILYFIYTGGSRVLGATSTPTLTAQAVGGNEIIINIRNTGAGTLNIYNIYLYNSANTTWGAYSSVCSSTSIYLDGVSYTPPSSGPIVSLKPGDTLTVICTTSAAGNITEVQVQANTGNYYTVVT